MAKTFLPYLVAFGWISLFILVGVFLRAKVSILQKGLVPTSIIAGTIGFIFINMGWLVVPTLDPEQTWISIQPGTFGIITTHLFAIGFVGIGLLKSSSKSGDSSARRKAYWRGSLWIALVFTMAYSAQSLLGFSIFSGWSQIVSNADNPIIGYLFGSGFTQGPGQTMAYANIWEGDPYFVSNARNIGMTFAAMGFFVSVLIGVPLARYGLRKGWAVGDNSGKELPETFVKGIMTKKEDQEVCGRAITHPANIDTFAYHMAIIFLVYGLAYFFGIWWQKVMPKDIAPLGIGMVFMWAMIIAKGVRFIGDKAKLDNLFDDGTIRRFTGMSVDFMVASVFMSIEVKAIQGMLVPILVTIVIGAAITLFAILWLGRRSPELGFERTLVTLGTCTGTVATGLLLLRIADPDFKTSVAEEVGMMNVIAMVTCAPIIYFGLPFAAKAGYPMFWIFAGLLVAAPIAMFVTRLIRKPQF